MRIGFAGPVSLRMLTAHIGDPAQLPIGYEFPPMALWVEELLRRGHEVTLFSLAPEIATPQCFVGPRLRICLGRRRPRHRARDLFRQEREDLRAAMQASDCDVIHAHWTYEFALAALASGKPTLVTAHDAPGAILRLHHDAYRALRFVMAWMVARRARDLTAVSEYVANHFRQVLRYSRDIAVVPNGLSDEWFGTLASCSRTRSNVFTFATVLSGWGVRKNGQLALDAFHRLKKDLPDIRLIMFGEGYEPTGLAHNWAAARGLTTGVDFVGRLEHQQLALRLATEVDVLIHPSREESFCMAAAEAMALGIPVIAGNDSGGIVDVVRNVGGGVLVRLRPAEMASKMRMLFEDAALRRALSRNGRSRVQSEYSTARVFDAYDDLYRQLTTRGGSAVG